ncbi:MAG: cobyric acid synthase [Thermoplasmataceae archaeon]
MRMLMVLGTSSSAGKTLITTALCRIFSESGYSVSPFKAMNMSLNSISIADGSEIARAQWLQSRAAKQNPLKEMNPILLKPEGNGHSQVILLGRSRGVMSIQEYQGYLKRNGRKAVDKSISLLGDRFDIIIAEGAGSPAEINLMDHDIANTYILSRYAQRSILVGDIDRGGVFASLYGTVMLMKGSEKVSGFIINKMRGESGMLKVGLERISELTSKPVLGVMPYIDNLNLPGEDSLDYSSEKILGNSIAVIKYPYMENFSDLDPVFAYGGGIRFVSGNDRDALDLAKLIILPGSKNVKEDLRYIRSSGLADSIISAASGGTKILGICGGYQMMGREIRFPDGTSERGLGMFDSLTVYNREKTVRKTEYRGSGTPLGNDVGGTGYEIHYGSAQTKDHPMFSTENGPEGSVSSSLNAYGTNIHGILENTAIYRFFTGRTPDRSYGEILEDNISLLADIFAKNINVEQIISWFR